jgi:hypothetical protein
MSETVHQLRQRVARDAGLSSEVASTWVGENEDVCVAEALAHAERTRGSEGKREVIQRLTEIGNREEPAAIRARLARELGLPSERWGEISDRAETPDEIARGIANVLRRAGDHEGAERADRKAGTLQMSAAIHQRHAENRGSMNDMTSDDMNHVLNEALRGQPGA